MDAATFFEQHVPGLLEPGPLPRGLFAFEVAPHGRWVLDLRHAPPRVGRDTPGTLDGVVYVHADDLLRMLHDPYAEAVLRWQGRLRATGDAQALRRLRDRLFPRPPDDPYYTCLNRLVPDPRFRWLNHGYDGDVDPADGAGRYSVALLRRVLQGTPLPGARVLDVGCGRGAAAGWMARRGARVVGLDACAEAVAFCRRHEPDAEFVQGDAMRLPFPDGAFDVVLNLESMHGYPDPAAFRQEALRVLAPGGVFTGADSFQAPPDLPTEDLTEAVARAVRAAAPDLEALLLGAIDPDLGNETFVRELLRGLTCDLPRLYDAGRRRYHAWRILRG